MENSKHLEIGFLETQKFIIKIIIIRLIKLLVFRIKKMLTIKTKKINMYKISIIITIIKLKILG